MKIFTRSVKITTIRTGFFDFLSTVSLVVISAIVGLSLLPRFLLYLRISPGFFGLFYSPAKDGLGTSV
jgi:hypothetical protein